MASFAGADLTQDENGDLSRAWRTSILRLSSANYRPRFLNIAELSIGFLAGLLSFLVQPVVAYLTPSQQLLTWGDWVASIAGWSLSASFLLEKGRMRNMGTGIFMAAVFFLTGLALNLYPQIKSEFTATAIPIEHSMLSAAVGMLGLPLILQLVKIFDWIDDRVGWVLSPRIRASDVLLVELAVCASSAWSGLTGGGGSRWDHPAFSRKFIRRLLTGAKRVDQAAGLSRRTGWSQLKLRSREGAPYFAVAAVLRDHAQSVATAKTRDDWVLVCQSLTAGAVAAARNDWTALLAHAPSSIRARRTVALQMLRRLLAPAVLALSGILLPIWISLGEYGASVRTTLLVAAVLSLLPSSAGSNTVMGVLEKALPFRSEA